MLRFLIVQWLLLHSTPVRSDFRWPLLFLEGKIFSSLLNLTWRVRLPYLDIVVYLSLVSISLSVLSVVSVVRKKFIGQIQLYGNLPSKCSIQKKPQMQFVVQDRMNSICPMIFFRTTDTTDTTIWKPGFNSYSSWTRRIRDDIYNQRGRRPSWLLTAHIRQVREE